MFCKSCGFDLGVQPTRFCSRCGTLTQAASPLAPAAAPEDVISPIPAEALAAPLDPAPQPEPQPGAMTLAAAEPEPPAGPDPRLVVGVGSLALVLALGALWWAMGQRPAAPPLPEPAAVPAAPPPPLPPAVEVPPPPPLETTVAEPPQPLPPVQESSRPQLPRPRPAEVPAPEPVPLTPPSTPVRPVGEPAWLNDLRRDLAQCDGGFFCREKVRWKYCDGRWNSVPECAVGQNRHEP